MDKPEKKSTSHGTVGAVMGLLSKGGSDAPPDGSRPVSALPWPDFGSVPTQLLPIIPPSPRQTGDGSATSAPVAPPGTPSSKVEARAVIVYEPEPRRSWGLWVLTAVLVSLTVGVVLGQTVANQPGNGKAVSAATEPAPGFSTPPATPSPAGQPLPVTGQRVTAPLGKAKTQRIEVTGGSTLVTVRSVDLGDQLFSIATLDGSAIPKVITSDHGPKLELVRTGAGGTVGAEIQLNAKVKWTVQLDGGSAQQEIDMRAGGLAGVTLSGGASRAVLQLPQPKGTVALSVSGGVSELNIVAGSGIPVRVKLGKSAEIVTIDGKPQQKVKAGTTLTSSGWSSSHDRYEIATTAKVDALHVAHL